MASALAGKYQHDKDENLLEYYKALGLPSSEIEKYRTPWRSLEVVVDGNSVSLTTNAKTLYHLDKPTDEVLPNGHKLQSVARVDGSKLVIESKSPDGRQGTRTYDLLDNGLVITMVLEGSPVVGKIYYKRV